MAATTVDVARPGLDGRERELAPAAVTSWRISAALSAIGPVIAAIVLGFLFAGRWSWAILAGTLALLVLTVVVLPGMRYRRWRWQLTDLAVELRYGILVHQQETVPYFRIQQIDINAGPVDRLLELATLRVQTASASGTALLPGIAAAEAPAVRAELLARAADAVAEHPGDLRDAV
ncbi:MAG: PH domain-containing protein [Nitriliruptoraceae bacterium]